VHADADVIAFLDIRPVNTGHVLVVPREHSSSLEELDEQLGTKVFAVAHRVARALHASGLPCDGVNMFLADGEAAGQEVFHVHLHVIPRLADDGFRISARCMHTDRTELDATATQIRASLEGLPPPAQPANGGRDRR
jgi:histidine triad (HIT) family protein